MQLLTTVRLSILAKCLTQTRLARSFGFPAGTGAVASRPRHWRVGRPRAVAGAARGNLGIVLSHDTTLDRVDNRQL